MWNALPGTEQVLSKIMLPCLSLSLLKVHYSCQSNYWSLNQTTHKVLVLCILFSSILLDVTLFSAADSNGWKSISYFDGVERENDKKDSYKTYIRNNISICTSLQNVLECYLTWLVLMFLFSTQANLNRAQYFW